MDIEKCIEVARDVWKSDLSFYDDDESAIKIDGNVLSKNGFCNLVNSWSGFGRTVEGIKNSNLSDQKVYEFSRIFDLQARRYFGVELESINDNKFFSLIHLAALEILKDG